MTEKEDYTKDVGPAGPTGPEGPKGDPGPAGATGATGATGAQGIQGIQGNTGPQGIQGEEGPPGTTTWDGITDKPTTFPPDSIDGVPGLAADDQHVLDAEVETQILTRQKARCYRNAAQTISNATWQRLDIDTDSFDTDNITDLVNHRIIPTRAGYYSFFGQVNIDFISGTPVGTLIAAIYKNGAEVSRGHRLYMAMAGLALGAADLIYCNGSTDYVELWIYENCGFDAPLEVVSSGVNYFSCVGPF